MEAAILIIGITILILLIIMGVYFFNWYKLLKKTFLPLNIEPKTGTLSFFHKKETAIVIEQREEFFRIVSFFLKILGEKKSRTNIKRYQKEYMEFGTRLYLFASENTIQKFLEFKHLMPFVDSTTHEHKIALLWFAEFNLLLRKDLGLDGNPKLIKDYFNILLAYWDDEEIGEEEMGTLKDHLSKITEN